YGPPSFGPNPLSGPTSKRSIEMLKKLVIPVFIFTVAAIGGCGSDTPSTTGKAGTTGTAGTGHAGTGSAGTGSAGPGAAGAGHPGPGAPGPGAAGPRPRGPGPPG